MVESNLPLYLQATLKVRAGKLEALSEVMKRVVPVLESHDWKLLGAWVNLVGRLNVVTDLWRVPAANAIPTGFIALMQELDWPDISRGLAECIEDETLQLMLRAPFDPGRI